MGRGKKKSLVKNVTLSLVVLLILYILSIVNFQFFVSVKEKQQVRISQYNNLDILLNELYMTANETERLSDLYISTKNTKILKDYQNHVDVYEGTLARNDEKYTIYHNLTIPYPNIIKKEISDYNPSLLNDVNFVLNEFEQFLIKTDNIIKQGKDININNMHILEDDLPSNDTNIIQINHSIQSLKNKLNQYHLDSIKSLDQLSQILHISWYGFNTLLVLYGFYLIFKIYILLIKPIKKGHALVEEISHGNDNIRLKYRYNNELTDVVNNFNKYLDISQNSLKLIIEQYNKLKLYSDVGEINYIEVDFIKKQMKINYSKRFVERYYLMANDMSYSFKEYLTLVHRDDLNGLLKQLHVMKHNENKDYKVEYRIKFPMAKNYCYVSTIGQRSNDMFIGVQVDISDLKLTEKLLQDREEQYRLIVENTTDLIVKINPQGEILYASNSYREIFKKDLDSNYGKFISDFDESLKLTNLKWMDNVLNPPYTSQEKILVDTSYGERWISWNNDAIFNENNELEYIISVGHDITAIQDANKQLQYESEHDILTKLLNRRGLFHEINNLKNIDNLAAFFIDINNFKNINDFYGHEIGDMIIVKIAEDLIIFEEMGCIIGRLSGDEFIILVPNFTSLNFIKAKIQKITSKNHKINHNDIFITSSIGYSIYPEDTDDLNKIIAYADLAMYEAKMSHIKRSLRFTKEMYDVMDNKVKTATALKKAIDNDEFEVYFQPINNYKSNNIEYLEALVRWHSNNEIIYPGGFIPIAEESGFMQALDLLIIKKSLKNYREYKHYATNSKTKLSINVSPIVLLQDEFPLRLSTLVRKYKLNNTEICVEISENTFVNNIEQSKIQINKLRKLGFIVALDDFGREYSSLSILNHLEFDVIKIDRVFINNLTNETNVEIINMIIKVAHLKNKEVIAEGVETNEQKDKLILLGCQKIQGFLFARPQRMKNGILIKQEEMN